MQILENGVVRDATPEEEALYNSYCSTEEELNTERNNINIGENKNYLNSSDYSMMKFMEDFMYGNLKSFDFVSELVKRKAARDTINAIEAINEGSSNIDEIKLNLAKANKISEISSTSQITITNGIDYNNEHFSLGTYDQINLSNLILVVNQGGRVLYHADGEKCREFSKEEIMGVITTATKWITYHTTYCNFLKNYINSLNSIDDISKITYGMELPEPLNTEFKNLLGLDTSSSTTDTE